MKVAIVGSRSFTNYNYMSDKLSTIFQKYDIDIIVSGGAEGADTLAEKYAEEYQKQLEVYKPNWNKYGKIAGLKRNTLIVENSDIVVAFPMKGSKGTYDTIRKAKEADKIVYVFNIDLKE